MLAIQHPRMASPRRSSPGASLPFGYMGEQLGVGPPGGDIDYLLSHPPPAPAPGTSLLTDAETNFLHSSMDHMTSASNEYGEHNFGEGFNTTDWVDIPNLMGVASGFGVPMQNLPHNNFHGVYPAAASNMQYSPLSEMPPSSMSMSMPHTAPGIVTTSPQDFTSMPMTSAFFASSTPLISTAPLMNPTTPTFVPPNGMRHGHVPSPPMQQHSPDVLEAATVLQGGSHHRAHSIHNIPQHRPSNQGMGPPVGHLRHQDMSDFRLERRRMSESIEPNQGDIFVKWAFEGDSFPNVPRQPRASAPVNLQYGSDVRFNGNQPFLPQSEKESFEGLAQEQDRYMKAVKLSDSVDSTRHPSPELNAARGLSLRTMGRPNSLSIDTSASGRMKRPSLDDDEAQSAGFRGGVGRKRKGNTRASTDSPNADGLGGGKKKRRKSAGATKKENLTEKQKRENHIKSERKRRGVIDVGFKNLNKMVPSLSGQNPSKAATLTSAQEFFIELAAGNAELVELLRRM